MITPSSSLLCLPRLSKMQRLRSGPAPSLIDVRASLRYWLAEYPVISRFRWDHNAWGSSWIFLFTSLALYLFLIGFLKLVLIKRKRPLPFGPIPAIHNFILFIISLIIFVGCWEATAVEIKETRWIWRKSKSAPEWILCFPLGTRPAGRVFFWSYTFYLSKYYELLDTFVRIVRKKPLGFLHIFSHMTVVCMCFSWIEFSQSLQILGILTNTLLHMIIYSYFICSSMGLAPQFKKFVANCQFVGYVLTFVGYTGLLRLHFRNVEGCNGMGAWLFTALLNGILFLLFLYFHRKEELLHISNNGTPQTQTQGHG
eukprot:Gb_34832 [translate_table: standard]